MIIAVDFDGTLCENAFPNIGVAHEYLFEYLRDRRKHGDYLILWTCRCGKLLNDAVRFCADNGITFDKVNENAPWVIEQFGSDTRKIYADVYIDDKAMKHESVWDMILFRDGKKRATRQRLTHRR